jgi:hypothetical protein
MATQYFLKNQYSLFPLTIDPTAPYNELRASSSNDSPLEFVFTPITSSLYKICTNQGTSSLCLDVFGDNKTTPHLSDPGNYSGQQWTLIPTNGAFKLSNQYTGTGFFLDVYSDTKQAFMSTGDFSGQYWNRVEVVAVSSSSSLTASVCNGA